MPPEGVLSRPIAIGPIFDNPRKTKEKRNWSNIDINVLSSKVWTYITCRYKKSCIQPCHGHFTVMPKRPKMCRSSSSSSSSSSSHFLFPRDFSGTIEDTDIINTLLEPLWPADVPFGCFVDIAPHFWREIPPNPNFGGVNRRFRVKRAKYWKFHGIETTASILTKFGTTIDTTKRSRHLEKSQKSRYIRNGLTDFYENWYADAKWAS